MLRRIAQHRHHKHTDEQVAQAQLARAGLDGADQDFADPGDQRGGHAEHQQRLAK
ncbi:hypothetical protein D3C85_1884550 [compost metagenome]